MILSQLLRSHPATLGHLTDLLNRPRCVLDQREAKYLKFNSR